MKRTPLKRKTPLRGNYRNSLKTHRPMRRVSKRRAKENKQYTEVRKQYLTEHPRCQVCSNAKASDIHHRRGRWKSRLTEVAYFIAVCRPCHERIHHNPAWAYEVGLLIAR